MSTETLEPHLLTNAPAGSPAWLAARAGKITASTAASILAPGEPGAYGTPLGEFLRIKAEIEGQAVAALPDDEEYDEDADEDDDEPKPDERVDFAWGLQTEEIHRAMVAKLAKVEIAPGGGVWRDAELPWLSASPDGLIAASDEYARGIAELKAPTDFGVRRWRDGAPRGYVIQAHIQMRVMRADWGIVSALIPPKPRWQRVYDSPEMSEWILEGLTTFWDEHVMRDIPPPATGNDKDLRALKALFPQSTSRRIVFSPAAVIAAQELAEAKAVIKDATVRKKEATAFLIGELQDAEVGLLPNGTGLKYKSNPVHHQAKPARDGFQRKLLPVKNP